jgi:ABC-type antimicrobial peptide transport system permease subunit
MTDAPTLTPSRLRPGDLARVASVGLRTRRVRAGLSALGIAIGVATIVAVLGLSSSSQAGLLAEIDHLGTNDLFLGLGAVALLVGAVGVANIMIISVLERRSEIGLRRALGATKGQIRAQFLLEAVLLAMLGGLAGVGAGVLATAVYASTKGWTVVIPPLAWGGGFAAALAIGAVAGLVPALRAARLSPTEALRTV